MVTLLAAKAVEYEYPGPVVALRGADLTLGSGELLCVIGPNGSGKSTLLRCLGGLLAPTRGAVFLEGKDLVEHECIERARRLAIVPQYLPLLPDVRVIHFVLGGRYSHLHRFKGWQPHDLSVARAALAQSDAADLESRLMSDLSGGQRQRVLLARALAQEARILLVDEPTNSLDPEHQVRVFALVRSLADEGRAVLVITHDLNLASQFATRVVLLCDGRIVADGPVESVLTRSVLAPVYGEHLHFGSVTEANGIARPIVLPWWTKGAGASP
jgi:iron complex transport system ATP-binding protein